MISYTKSAVALGDLVDKLADQGLEVSDADAAVESLKRIGYFRLIPFIRILQDGDLKHFRDSVSFNDIIVLYELDRSIRLVCMDALERIEVFLRSALSNSLSLEHGPHWYLNENLFDRKQNYYRLNQYISSHFGRFPQHIHFDNSINHYHETYNFPATPPSWAVFEHMTFGKLSKVFSSLKVENSKIVSNEFGVPDKVLRSWIFSISAFRNCCAHHERVVNRKLSHAQPIISKDMKPFIALNTDVYSRIAVISILMDKIGYRGEFCDEIVSLFSGLGSIVNYIDIPQDWENHTFLVG